MKIILLLATIMFYSGPLYALPEYSIEVKRVIDGDTIVAVIDMGYGMTKKDHIRLYGIDTPEMRDKDPQTKKKAFEAKEFVKKSIKEAKIVTMDFMKLGNFGRPLGVIYLDGVNLNDQLIDAGLAVEYMRN